MHVFTDNAGRTWSVAVNVTAVKRCRALAGVDLLGLVDGDFEGLARLLADPVALADTLYVLCRDEADRQGVTDEDFGRALAGDALGRAADAFVEEYRDFFPDPRVRAALGKAFEAGRRVGERLAERALAELEAVDPDAVATRWIASSGGSRASSASTPGPSPSAS